MVVQHKVGIFLPLLNAMKKFNIISLSISLTNYSKYYSIGWKLADNFLVYKSKLSFFFFLNYLTMDENITVEDPTCNLYLSVLM